jgi:hypothetical protein
VKGRLRVMDENEWRERHPQYQNKSINLKIYVAERDMVEVKYYARITGWTPRKVFDYWETLNLICTFT